MPGSPRQHEGLDQGLPSLDPVLVPLIALVHFLGNQGLEVELGHEGRFHVGRLEDAKAAGAGKDGSQGVVIPGRDRVELVVVAASAGDGQPQEGLGEGIDLLVHQVVEHFHLVLLGDGAGADRQKPGPQQGSNVGMPRLAGGVEVSRNLVFHETIVGKVPIEAVDDVVPIAPGIGHGDVFVQAAGIGVAGDVQPMAAPAFPVARRGQQAVH